MRTVNPTNPTTFRCLYLQRGFYWLLEKRYQWYQSDSTVFVSVMRKGIDPATLCVTFVEDAVTIRINGELITQLNLAYKIDPNKSTYKCTPMKIELKLAKTMSSSWSCLERADPAPSFEEIARDGDL
ncbi:unnamed protein product, partial [Hydatigera taeniaeformis]|uniref:CS domain-containing protein n=1 Tax=Hydatigena taeniaeformis TaxID=6205 RepID=A0A0R3WS79_HYDTA